MTTSALLAALLLAGTPQRSDEILFSGLGPHSRTISTKSPKAQEFFNQGLNFLYAFNHDEAIRSFKAAARQDPTCAMAFWGLAMANGPHVNNTYVPPDREKSAFEAIRLAKALSSSATPVERALIDAGLKRFAQPQPETRRKLDEAFARAMAQVWRRFPKDPDVGILYAESLMNLQPWDYWTSRGTPKGNTHVFTAVIDDVLDMNPRHPQALHLAIHAWEASSDPHKATAAADKLRDLQPALGHMVHMPSHIDVRTGEWRKAVISNEKAIQADDAYREVRPRIGFYRLYMGHNRHMLAHAAMMTGESAKAIKAVDELIAAIPVETIGDMAPVLDGYFASPYEVRVRFGKWDEILAMPELPEVFPLSRTLRHVARGIAYAAKGDVQSAHTEANLFQEARKRIPDGAGMGNNTAVSILAVAEPMLNGEILIAEGKIDEGIEELHNAVQAEDRLNYNEPPDWINPVRHALGAALMRAGKHRDAERVYRDDLRILPNNGWSLYGLAQALRMQQKDSGAVDEQFKQIWAQADLQITSSCMCLPGE